MCLGHEQMKPQHLGLHQGLAALYKEALVTRALPTSEKQSVLIPVALHPCGLAALGHWSTYAVLKTCACAESQASEHLATQHDDTCKLCGREGDLLCCDGCSAAFHLSCLSMQRAPDGDWYCAVCRDA